MQNALERAGRWRMAAWAMAAGLVALPLVAMRFTAEVHWTGSDFAFAAIMIGGTGLAFELAVRMSADRAYRAACALALAAAFLLIWINLAVGIIGSEDDAANIAFAGVLATAGFGAVLARFRAAGMARAMLAAAVAQVAVFVAALVAGWGFIGPVTLAFTALWLASAWLFRAAARRQPSP
jgi:hypothetical protein